MKSAYLLTGMPGTGKTTIIKQIISACGENASGFYTEEIRVSGIRQGFRIVTTGGQTAILAHLDIHSPYTVSKYGVDIEGLEKIGLAALRQAADHNKLIILDEIGKMELFSDPFKELVLNLIESNKRILGTIMLKPHPFADCIKQKTQVELLTVTRQNQAQVIAKIQSWLKHS
jgi:nucleoside-triphosphatase